MKQINSFLLFLFVFLNTYNLFAQESLIPRQELFKDEKRTHFTFSGDGQTLYYKENPSAINQIFALDIPSQKTRNIEIPGVLKSMIMFDRESMLMNTTGPGGNHLYFLNQDKLSASLLPFSAHVIQIRQPTKKGMVVIIQREPSDSSGFYLVDKKGRAQFLLPFDGFTNVFFDDNAQPVAAQRAKNNGSYALYYRQNNNWKSFAQFDWNESRLIGGFQKIASVTKDGQNIFFTDNRNTDKNQLLRFHIPSKTSEVILEPTNADILPFGMLLNTEHEVAIATSIYAHSEQFIVDKSFEADFMLLQKNISGDISFVDHSWDGESLLIREFTGHIQRYHHFDRKKKKLTYLVSDRPHLEKFSFVPRHFNEVTTSDGLKLPLHVYLPAGTDTNKDGIPDKALPTVMYVHGGPWVGLVHFNQWFHQRNYQLLANRGYAVIVCEFRSTTGLGKKVTESSYKQWGADMTRDKAEIAQWAIKNGIARKDKVGIWGWSYGGYATMAGLAFYPDLYACGISMYGISDLVSFCKTDFANNALWRNAVGNVNTKEGEAMLKAHSPFHAANQVKAPILMTTGSKDARVPQSQMDKMAEKLSQLGNDVTYFYYPEEVHDYRDKHSWISFWAISEQFLKKNLGGKAEPVGDDLEKANYKMVFDENRYALNTIKKH